LAKHAGQVRTRQNWIGRDPYTPAGADFIPPPARHVKTLVDDLCDYLNRQDIPPLIQAAVAHVQFETIHPFVDGNGRVGRSLIGAVLARRDVCTDVIPPVSLALSREREAYVEALTAWRFDEGGAAHGISLLARSAEDAALASARLAAQVDELQDNWREQAGRPRADSAAVAVIELLPAYPILNAEKVAQITGRSDVSARNALNHLEDAGVLQRVTVGKRNRMWESTGLFALVDELLAPVLESGRRPLAAEGRGRAVVRRFLPAWWTGLVEINLRPLDSTTNDALIWPLWCDPQRIGALYLARAAPMDITVLISSNSANAVVGAPDAGGGGQLDDDHGPKERDDGDLHRADERQRAPLRRAHHGRDQRLLHHRHRHPAPNQPSLS
jgi:hypothetical protein